MNRSSSNGRIKVVTVLTRLNIGGPGSHAVELGCAFDPSRVEHRLVCGRALAEEGSMIEEARSRGVQPIVLPEIVGDTCLRLGDLRGVARLHRLLRRERPHVVHTHTAKAGLLGRLAARLARVPVVVHTFHGHILSGYFGSMKSHALRSMERVLAGFTDRLVAVSDQVKRDLVSFAVAPAAHISVVPLGFDLGPFLRAEEHRGGFRHELGLDGEARLVGIVGRIFPIKNHVLFLDAAARVATSTPCARFVVVGDGALRSETERRARSLGIGDRVFFTGWRRDLPRIYADLDVLAVTSHNEGTPMSAIEAMACGRPVVATRVGGLPDVVADGETGYLVRAGDADSLASAVARLVRDPELSARLGRAGRGVARERFTADRLVRDLESLYRELLLRKNAVFPGPAVSPAY